MTDQEWQNLKDKVNKPSKRKKPDHPESKLQQNCVTWFRLQYPNLVLFAIPNGGKRGDIEAKIMKGEGVLAGVADLFLMYPNKEFHGLFIEMKFGKGSQTDSQIDFQRKAESAGFKYEVANSFDRFREISNNYLK